MVPPAATLFRPDPHDSALLEVALPVPLRSTFTYAVPASFNGEELVGGDVVVPFRNRAMIGVGLAISDRAPEIGASSEIAELMDRVPALPPKLIELGQWISRYYLAPIGETFRAMLPPEIEFRHDREYWLTSAGRAYLQDLAANEENTECRSRRAEISPPLRKEKAEASASARLGPAPHARWRSCRRKLVRRGHPRRARNARAAARRARRKSSPGISANSAPAANAAEEKIREVLTATRGPLPLNLLA